MASRMSLKSFLVTARQALLAPLPQRPKPLSFVVGNESADLDSLCSALILAYFRTHTPPHTLHIPLCNLPRADLALRPELTAALNPAGLQPDDLITISDLPKDGLAPQDTRWFLVDHNVLTGDLATTFSDTSLIVGCIDHHDDEGSIPQNLPPEQPRVIAKCGSCMSLVLEHCREIWDRLTAENGGGGADAEQEEDAALARVALAPILMDTSNLTSRDKTTDRDVRAVELAESKLGRGPYDRTAYYGQLAQLKEQIQGLSYRDILRKDYKRWSDGSLALGVSSVVQGFAYLFREIGDKAEFLAALSSWAREQRLDIAAVMTTSRPDVVFTRELLVWGLNKEAGDVVKEFERKYGDSLGLEKWGGGELDGKDGGGWRACWRQRKVEHSRKQVAPMLREVMRESARL
ncbi:DHH phosphoesterase [Canariomyces notabilis]|uniref:DHH phosphoesterase n=1 Tax=Canariomyces notabilis TaxID=2074819 RepID=A0AAN6T9C7_9PEZI|nr:DHH phosphoesterase [Canariomyces arenarius]